MHRDHLRIRDPFLLRQDDGWLLFGTVPDALHFACWRSADLVEWQALPHAFVPTPGFWGTADFWAPEVHPWHGRWIMLATCANAEGGRGTLALPHRLCLDGTLNIEDGQPWLVFCQEWLQVHDGGMWAVRLHSIELTFPAW